MALLATEKVGFIERGNVDMSHSTRAFLALQPGGWGKFSEYPPRCYAWQLTGPGRAYFAGE